METYKKIRNQFAHSLESNQQKQGNDNKDNQQRMEDILQKDRDFQESLVLLKNYYDIAPEKYKELYGKKDISSKKRKKHSTKCRIIIEMGNRKADYKKFQKTNFYKH